MGMGNLAPAPGRLYSSTRPPWASATAPPMPGSPLSHPPPPVVQPLSLGEQLRGERLDLDRLGTQELGMLQLRQQQQVIDDAAHAVELVGDQRHGVAPLFGVVAEQ